MKNLSNNEMIYYPLIPTSRTEDAESTRKPNPNKLSRGPVEFGYTGALSSSEIEEQSNASNELYYFIANYVAKSYGMSFINKWLKDNKGKSLLYLTTACDLAYAITLIKNHEPTWERDHLKMTLEEDELEKYDNYQDLENTEELNKYSPRTPRFSAGIGVKRTFGSVMWNEEGVSFYDKTCKVWKNAFMNREIWEWMCRGWNAWIIKNNFGIHWRKKKRTRESMNEMDGNKEGGGHLNDNPVELLLPDDEDFDHDRGQSSMNSPTKIDCLGGKKSGVVSEEKTRENDEYNEGNGKTLRYGSEDGGMGNEAARYIDKEYSTKPPEGYQSMLKLEENGRASDIKRQGNEKLNNAEEEEYSGSSSDEEMEVARRMQERKKAKQKKKAKKMSAAKGVSKGKKGDQSVMRFGLRSSTLDK